MARNEDRHSHIGIRLQYRSADKWEHFEALGWNAVGFNFYHADELTTPTLELKRGLTHFVGNVVWRSQITSRDVIESIIVNELIYERSKELSGDKALHARLIKLIRVSGMVDEKRKFLASLGHPLHDSQIAEMIARRKIEHPMFHYGVQVESGAWAEVVKNALNISSVVTSLEKWSDAMGKR
jgi:hypothetical protein